MGIKFPGEIISPQHPKSQDPPSQATSAFAGVEKFGEVDSSSINVTNINADNITTGTLSADRIGANSITAAKIVANTITATEIAANTITATQIAGTTITAAEIVANTITATQIAASTITATEMNVTTLSAIAADLGTITAGSITGNTIKTAASGNRVEMTPSGFIVYDTGGAIGAFDWGGAYLVSNQVFNFAGTGNSLGQIFYSTDTADFNMSSSRGIRLGTGSGFDVLISRGLTVNGDVDMNDKSIKEANEIILVQQSKGHSSSDGSVYFYVDGANDFFGSRNSSSFDGRFSQVAQ